MKEDWKTYCLMAGIAIIEEFTKPDKTFKFVKSRNKVKRYTSYRSIRLKIKDKKTIDYWMDTTRIWEKKLKQEFINKDILAPKKENDQYRIHFNTNWAYYILKEIKQFPSIHTNKAYYNKIKNWRFLNAKHVLPREEIKNLQNSKSLYNELFKDKFLAAGAFIVSFDLEFRGSQSGRMDLTMSEKYKDFLQFMLNLANHYGWSTKDSLVGVNLNHSLKLGIKATPQYLFRLKTSKLNEIYGLGGPMIDVHKDKCLTFHINRSKNFVKGTVSYDTKFVILDKLMELGSAKSTELQFFAGVGLDVVLQHLNNFYKRGLVNKERKGKYFLWSVKDACESRNTISIGRERISRS